MRLVSPALRRRWLLPLCMFTSTFAWSFVFVSLPFHIQRVSTVDSAATLRWTGWILGVSSLVTVATSPLWGRLAERFNPKTLYVWIELLQGAGFFVMALARTLPELFLSRLLLGVMGAASTFAFIIAGSRGGDVRRAISEIQSAMTVAGVIGPLAGALVAARIGFRPSFVAGGILLCGCAVLVWRMVDRPERAAGLAARAGSVPPGEIATVCLLVLAGSVHVFFLTAILPQVLLGLGVPSSETLHAAGLVIFVSGLAAALGSLAAPRLAELVGDRRAVLWLLAASSLLLAGHALAPEVWSFGALRFVQVLAIAPVFPLSVAAIAQRASGRVIGIVNSSRIAAAFIGPVAATTLLSWLSPAGVYLILGASGLAVVPLLARAGQRAAAAAARAEVAVR